MLTVVLDTCVLWPSLQRDFLLSLAVEGVYIPAWSSATLDELEFHEAAKLQKRGVAPAEARARASSLIGQMRVAFLEADAADRESCEHSWALREIAARSGRHGPALTELEIMTVLARRYGMTEAMTLLRKLWR